MQRKVVHGTLSSDKPPSGSHGFLNRRPAVRIGSGSQGSENTVTTDDSGSPAAGERGIKAALAAGRHPVDFQQFGAVDRAVMAEIGRYQTQPRKSRADRARLRAALIPFFHLSGVAQ